MFSSVLLIFAAYMINAFRTITRDQFIAVSNIYEQPIYVSVIFVCVFSSFLQMLHVSRDIDSRTFESYLYGPVDETAYIISIFMSYSSINFLSIVCFPFLWIFGNFILTGIPVGPDSLIQLIFGYCLSNLILLIALCIGALAKKQKIAIWYLLLFHVILIGIILGNTVISKYLVPLKRSDVDLFSFFRNVFHFVYNSSIYFSPYTQFFLLQKNFHYSFGMVIIIWVVILISQVFFAVMSKILFKWSIT
jgi:hypothetical protein